MENCFRTAGNKHSILFFIQYFGSFVCIAVYEMLLCPGKCKNLNGTPPHINNNNNSTNNGSADVVNPSFLKIENFTFSAADMKRQYNGDNDDQGEAHSPDTAPATKIPHNEKLPTVEFLIQNAGEELVNVKIHHLYFGKKFCALLSSYFCPPVFLRYIISFSFSSYACIDKYMEQKNAVICTRQYKYLSVSIDKNSDYEVFLGGSCNPTTWRKDIAVPRLSAKGIRYFNPVRLPFFFKFFTDVIRSTTFLWNADAKHAFLRQ